MERRENLVLRRMFRTEGEGIIKQWSKLCKDFIICTPYHSISGRRKENKWPKHVAITDALRNM